MVKSNYKQAMRPQQWEATKAEIRRGRRGLKMDRDIYPSIDEQFDYSPFVDDEPRWVDPNPDDDPCPRCGRNEGAWDGKSCAPCGYYIKDR